MSGAEKWSSDRIFVWQYWQKYHWQMLYTQTSICMGNDAHKGFCPSEIQTAHLLLLHQILTQKELVNKGILSSQRTSE